MRARSLHYLTSSSSATTLRSWLMIGGASISQRVSLALVNLPHDKPHLYHRRRFCRRAAYISESDFVAVTDRRSDGSSPAMEASISCRLHSYSASDIIRRPLGFLHRTESVGRSL